jgi:hypothetical protein
MTSTPRPATAHRRQRRERHAQDVSRGGGGGGDVSGGGGGATATVSYRSWDIDLLYDVSDAWTFQVNFMYEKFL